MNEQLFLNGTVMSLKPIIAVHNFDKNSPVALMPKITDTHLNPNPFEKMSVNRAVQVLSNTVSKAISYSLEVRPQIFKGIAKQVVTTTALGCSKSYFLPNSRLFIAIRFNMYLDHLSNFSGEFNVLFDCLNKYSINRDKTSFAESFMSSFFTRNELHVNSNKIKCLNGLKITVSGK